MVLSALFVALFALFGVMAIDFGRAYGLKRELQAAADLAAMAAVNELPDQGAADTAARTWLDRNGIDPLDASIAPTIQFPQANEMQLQLAGGVDSYFGSLFGISAISVKASAAAALTPVALPYAIMSLNPSGCRSLNVRGSGTVSVTQGGATYTHSTCAPDALRVEGQASLSASKHDVIGGGMAAGQADLLPVANEGALPVLDPFDDLVQPVPAGPCYAGSYSLANGAHALSPGRYCQQLQVSATAMVTLSPGIYFFEAGLNVDGQGSFTSGTDEVLLVSTCPASPCNGAVPSEMRFAGQVDTTMTGHSAYRNIVVWIDRTAGPGAQLTLAGQAAQGLTGVIYAPVSKVDVSGGAGLTLTLNMSIVAHDVEFHGQADLDLPYDTSTAPTSLEALLVR
jgi:hypothetical protein